MENKLNYTQNGDYLIPNLTLSETETKPLGKYGRMRKKYLQENRPVLWNSMILSETLYPHLREIDETANRRLEQELGKPFPQEDELRVKSARLAELNIALNIDDKTPLEAMAEEAPPRAEIAKSA